MGRASFLCRHGSGDRNLGETWLTSPKLWGCLLLESQRPAGFSFYMELNPLKTAMRMPIRVEEIKIKDIIHTIN